MLEYLPCMCKGPRFHPQYRKRKKQKPHIFLYNSSSQLGLLCAGDVWKRTGMAAVMLEMGGGQGCCMTSSEPKPRQCQARRTAQWLSPSGCGFALTFERGLRPDIWLMPDVSREATLLHTATSDAELLRTGACPHQRPQCLLGQVSAALLKGCSEAHSGPPSSVPRLPRLQRPLWSLWGILPSGHAAPRAPAVIL